MPSRYDTGVNQVRSRKVFAVIASGVLLLTIVGGCAVGAKSSGAAGVSDLPAHPTNIAFDTLDWHVPLGSPFRHELADGLVAYVATDSTLPLVWISGHVQYGDIADPPGKEGLGYLLTRLMRAGGTESYPPDTLDMLLDLYAISIGFSLSDTRLEFSASFLSEHMDTALALLDQMLFAPAFDQKRLQQERAVLLEDIRHRFDNPGPILRAAHAKAMYAGAANSRFMTEASVNAISREDIAELHQRIFRRKGTILGATGDFVADSMLARLDKLFAPASDSAEPVSFPDVAIHAPNRALVVHKPISQAYVRMALPMFSRPHPDYYACSIMNHVLGGGSFSSWLNTSIRSDAGLTYSIYSSVESSYRYPGTFFVSFHTKTESASEAMRLVVDAMERMRTEGISETELSAAKQVLIDGLPSMFRSRRDIVEHYMWNEYYGREPDHFRVYPEKIQAITRDDVLRVARKYLHPDSLTYVLVGDTSALSPVQALQSVAGPPVTPAVITVDSLPKLP